jgi:hypothetical protein
LSCLAHEAAGPTNKCAVKFGLRSVVAVRRFHVSIRPKGKIMNRIVYIVGAVVIIIALLSFFGLR